MQGLPYDAAVGFVQIFGTTQRSSPTVIIYKSKRVVLNYALSTLHFALKTIVSLIISVASVSVFAVSFADKNRVASDNFNVFPTNADSLSFAADTPIFRSAVNNQGNYPSAA